MTDFLTALALVFVIEGIAYAAAPGAIRTALKRMEGISDHNLRLGGLIAATFGVIVAWLVRGGQ